MPALIGLSDKDTREYLDNEHRDRTAYLKPLHAEFEAYRRIFNFEIFNRDDKDELTAFLPGDGANIVNLMVAYLMGEKVEIKAHPIFPDYSQYPKASEAERWGWAVLRRNAEREAVPSIHGMALFNAILMGIGCTYTYWDEQIAEQSMVNPQTEDGEVALSEDGTPVAILTDSPIVCRSIWPLSVFWREGGPMGRYLYIMRVERQSVADVEEQFDVELPEAKNMRMAERYKVDETSHGVEVIDYWGWEKVGDDWVVVNAVKAGLSIVKEPEVAIGYEDLPYTIFSAYRTDQPEPEKRYLSALHPVKHAIYHLATLQSAMVKNVHRVINLPLFRTKSPRSSRAKIKVDSGLFNIVDLQPGEKLDVPQIPGFDSATTFEQGWLKEQIQEGSFSIPLLTERVPSGLAATRVIEQGIVRLQQPRRELEMAYQQDLLKIRNYAVNFAGDIPIRMLAEYRGVSGVVDMSGADLAPITYTVKLGGDLPLDDWRKAQLGLSMAGLAEKAPLSQKMQLERYWNVDQPEDVLEEKVYEAALNHPAVQAAALADALQGLGIQITAQEILGATGQGPPGPPQTAEQGLPASVQSFQERQGQEFGMMPANASELQQGPGPRGPLGPLVP